MPTALIAEDEPLLAAALQQALQRAWPELQVLAVAPHGHAAVSLALQQRPDVLFLDVRMPGQTGLEAAAELADDWPSGEPFPAIVFDTAYDQYALQAFEAQALDYLLKPVQPERLARTVARLQQLLGARAPAQGEAATAQVQASDPLEHTLAQLRALLAPTAVAASPPVEPLRVIQASVGPHIRLIPVEEVLVFEAADKYLRVLTAETEVLIRTPLKDLLLQISAQDFWQIHRGTVVRANAIQSVHRDEAGKLSLQLRGRSERWPVSRLYANRFKAM